ncbi:MAG: hypothetical protein HOW73_02950 [Polyangiaceae bacterium]|nr:hypothetical protein [Polyangiaceae bacterium]
MSAACAVALAALWLVAPISRTGAWDPHEADAADLARRIAVHRFGGGSLARPGDPPTIPTLSDLGMGELPFTSMAASFRVFGFHEWSGRLPLALWGLGGALSLYWLLYRLVHARAAFFAVVALSTMPLYYLHARTMVGDIVPMAAFAMAIAGFSLMVAEDGWRSRAGAAVLGGIGIFAGLMSRGLLLGVAAPLASVGVAALAARTGGPTRHYRNAVGGALVAAALATGVWFFRVAAPLVDQGHPLVRAVGLALSDPTPRDSTFDRMLRQIGHALHPWTAVIPIAVGHLLVRGPSRPETDGFTDDRASFAKLVLLSGASIAFAAHAFVVPWNGAVPFVGVSMLAGAVGVMAYELEWTKASRLAAIVLILIGLVLAVDLDREPSRTLAAFSEEAAAFPSTFAEPARKTLSIIALVAIAGGALTLFDAAPVGSRAATGSTRAALTRWIAQRREDARTLGRALYEAFHGNVVFLAVIFEAWLVGQAAMVAVGQRAGWEQVRKLPKGATTILVNAWWGVPLGILAAAIGFFVIRDGLRAILRRTGVSRGGALVTFVGAAGTLMSFSYYPALGEQLSPRGAFEVYRATRAEGEPIALVGTSPRAGALYFDEPLPMFRDVVAASAWLSEEGAPRRFLVLKAKDLPRLNSLWRARYKQNVAVLDARSSQNLLVSNVGGEVVGEDPFNTFLFDEPPPIARPVSARFLDNIELLGWDIVDERGNVVEWLVPRTTYRFRFYLRVDKRIPGSWMTFIHIDGKDKRHNLDHAPLSGKYPMNLWQPGDILRDEFEVTLEPNFVPGEYWVFFGFFQGEARMHVTAGSARDDRVVAGRIEVR